MRIRILGQFWNVSLVLLWLNEWLAVLVASPLAIWIVAAPLSPGEQAKCAVVFALLVGIAMYAVGLFSRRQRERPSGIVLRITMAIVLGALLALWLLPKALERDLPASALAAAAALAWFGVLLIRVLIGRLLDENLLKHRILVLGAGHRASALTRLRRRSDTRGFKLLGYLATENEAVLVPPQQHLREEGSLLEVAERLRVAEIVVAVDDRRRNLPIRDLIECRLAGIAVIDVVQFLERETGKMHLDLLHPSWIIFADGFSRSYMRRASARALDVIVGTALLLAMIPITLVIAVAVKLGEGPKAPVFYTQERVGLRGRTFRVLKFRSMRIDAESDGKARWAEVGDSRITHLGAFLRRSRMDELPQVVNVLLGEMSLVGPRPERPEFVSKLAGQIPYFEERHWVKPGITGWAQLCHSYGSSETDALEKLKYDLFYVKHGGLFFDIMILLRTLEVVLFGKGAR